ncbi:MAG TPA: HK97 gp10 family phage protein [Pirellulales bacterium]|nr:HK97 gp10 family phage protein [Pirellulales bacterium]
MPESVFQPNTAGLVRLGKALDAGGDAVLDEARLALRTWGEEFRRRLAAASPVGLGNLASSWQLVVEETDRGTSVAVGTNVRGKDGQPYPLYLELGTARIAGGRVVAWQPDEPPVVDWPAKSHALRKQAAAAGNLAQMPLVRPIGYEIARRLVEELRTIVGDAFDERFDGARF